LKQKHIHFIGIGGTLMGSLAQIAKQQGYRVSGSDEAMYPPMSDQLEGAGIAVYEGFHPKQLTPRPDLVIIGNAGLPRGHEAVEYVLDQGIPYTSGAQWLGEHVLQGRWVLAVSGTHGKTTTASMLAWILDQVGLEPGYLIGGVPINFTQSAQLGTSPFFVLEADEYDTSYFDRRSKFVHYRPRTLIINNLEYDHADIFDDIDAIALQFHHLLRTVPGNGLIVAPSNDEHINNVLAMGCWSTVARVGAHQPKKQITQDNGEYWHVSNPSPDGCAFDVNLNDKNLGRIDWRLLGQHNQSNALNAISAARHAGVPTEHAIEALNQFKGVKRRMEVIYDSPSLTLYDDFAHHPSAIRTTLEGLRKRVGSENIIAVIEPRTHTMALGTLHQELTTCCAAANQVFWYRNENIRWDLYEVVHNCVIPAKMFAKHATLVSEILKYAIPTPDSASKHKGSPQKKHIVIMSNGAFGRIYQSLIDKLPQQSSLST